MDIEQAIIQEAQGRSGEFRIDCICEGSKKQTMGVNADTGQYQCFRCGIKGNFKKNGNGHQEKQSKPEYIWNHSNPCTEHPYLSKKGVKSYGLRIDKHENLVVPLSISGNLQTLQLISTDKKILLKEIPKKGASFQVGQGAGNTVYVCEGYATGASIYEATGGLVCMAVDADNILSAAEILRQVHQDKQFVFCADNDEHGKGYQKAAEAARVLGGKVCMPEQVGYDFNDLHQQQGLEAVKEAIKDAKEPDTHNPFKKKVIIGADLEERFLGTLNLGWRIDRIIQESAYLNEIFGPPGSYKSFIAQDMALSTAVGRTWQGHEVKPCPVAYVAAEGQTGVLKRVKAWKIKHGIETADNFHLFPMPVILDDQNQLELFIAAIKTLPSIPGLIFIDTLARCMVGDENSTADMNKVVLACGRLSEETGAQVVLVHHTGKDTKKGPRGAIALTGATDTLITVVKTNDREAVMACERQKDDEPFDDMFFTLERVETGFINADGEAMASLVPIYDNTATIKYKSEGPKVTGANRVALDALSKAIEQAGLKPGEDVRAKQNAIFPAQVVHVDEWREMAYAMGVSAGDQSAKQKAFARSRNYLMDKGLIECWEDFYWIADTRT
ncbi:MAG: AAA family ATPase [Desulfobacteraceae bacterium]|nr:AAA family ATPase [Desulfobacteraceae bacterium]